MNFYEHQQQARVHTGRLMFLFGMALCALILLTAFVIAGMGYVFGFYNARFESYDTGQPIWEIAARVFDWQYLGSIALAIMAVVLLASLFRMLQLSSGGRSIAEQLGGRLLNTHPETAAEKRLLNIVEEMAIASGIPVPSVYLIEEAAINAFAAGYQPADAIIGVTRGTLEHLNRDELQGVIAHEFSHIFNGDMRLNLRLIALIYGVMVIALSGRLLLRGGHHSRKDRGAVIGAGLVLIVLGYVGVFFGNIIKAAISRQREFLADASAVQFTRNNQGIASALKKIGGISAHSFWQQHDADEVSHMLFAQGIEFHFLNGLMATHPPLATRIKRIDPQWDGQFIATTIAADQNPLSTSATGTSAFVADDVINAIHHGGELNDGVVAQATQQLSHIRQQYEWLCEQIHNPYVACGLVYVLLLDQNAAIRERQWQDLIQHQHPELVKQTRKVEQSLQRVGPLQVFFLLDMALPIMKLLSDAQYQQYKQQLLRLIKIDRKVELREWALFNLVDYYCRPTAIQQLHSASLSQRKPALAKLLSALANVGVSDEVQAKAAFGSAETELSFSLRWYPLSELTIQSLSEALQQIRQIKPLEKPRFLKACVRVVQHDNCVELQELEIIRCIAQALDCPLPMLDMAQ